MTDEQAENFLETIRTIFDQESIVDYTDAIEAALDILPKVDDYTWFGAIGDGVALINSRESRWWANATVEEVAHEIAREMY